MALAKIEAKDKKNLSLDCNKTINLIKKEILR